VGTYEDNRLFSLISGDVYRHLPVAVVIVDADLPGKIRFMNNRAAFLTGWVEADLVGQPVEVLVPGYARERHAEHRRGYLREPRTRIMGEDLDLKLIHKTGELIPVDVDLGPLVTEYASLVVAVVRPRPVRDP
jgi:PAS domain S-box-containing protein